MHLVDITKWLTDTPYNKYEWSIDFVTYQSTGNIMATRGDYLGGQYFKILKDGLFEIGTYSAAAYGCKPSLNRVDSRKYMWQSSAVKTAIKCGLNCLVVLGIMYGGKW